MPIKTTGQFGEYAVAAELCRRGWVATTFTRNIPGFDILALNPGLNKNIRIQVKTVVSGEWSLDVKKYLDFDENRFEEGIQEITGKKKDNKTDYVIFVKMNSVKTDKFYILKNEQLKDIIFRNYVSWLKKVGGKRPRNPKTTHTAIRESDLEKFENNWQNLLR